MRSMKDLYRKIMKVALIFAGLFAFFFLINLFFLVTNGAIKVVGNTFVINDGYPLARFNFWFSGSLIIAFIILARIMHDFIEKRGKLVDAESYKRAMRAKKAAAASKTDFITKSDEVDKIKDTTTLIARRKKEREEQKRVKDLEKAEKAAIRENNRLEKEERKAEEARLKEEQRLLKEEQKAEENRIKEVKRIAEENEKAEKARILEEQRILDASKKAEEDKLKEEQEKALESVEEIKSETIAVSEEKVEEKVEEKLIVVPVVAESKQTETANEVKIKSVPVKRKVITKTKTDIIALINDTTDVSKNKANKFLKAFAEVVKDTLKDRNDVVLNELGTFTTIEMPAKDAVNPQTKEKIVVPAHHQVRFRISDDFKTYFDEEIIKLDDPLEQTKLEDQIIEQEKLEKEEKVVEQAKIVVEEVEKELEQTEIPKEKEELKVEKPTIIIPLVEKVKPKKQKAKQKTKTDFINMMDETTDLSKNKANKFLKAFAEVIKESLLRREDVKLDELGTFTTILMPAKDAVNPQTHKKIVVPAHHQVRFRISNPLKELFENLPVEEKNNVSLEEVVKKIDEPLTTKEVVKEEIEEPIVIKEVEEPKIVKKAILPKAEKEVVKPVKVTKKTVVTKTKADFINIIVDNSDISKNKASKFLKAFASTIKDSLTSREDVDLPGFGTFTTIEMPAKDAVNPQTQEKIVVPAHHQVRFRIDSDFKNKFN